MFVIFFLSFYLPVGSDSGGSHQAPPDDLQHVHRQPGLDRHHGGLDRNDLLQHRDYPGLLALRRVHVRRLDLLRLRHDLRLRLQPPRHLRGPTVVSDVERALPRAQDQENNRHHHRWHLVSASVWPWSVSTPIVSVSTAMVSKYTCTCPSVRPWSVGQWVAKRSSR